ncbi:hypothetical protein PMAYCL1PPCAC_26967, partial [Pristionchus mayeri]
DRPREGVLLQLPLLPKHSLPERRRKTLPDRALPCEKPPLHELPILPRTHRQGRLYRAVRRSLDGEVRSF